MQQKRFESCGKPEIRAFLAYVGSGHAADGGQWGNLHLTQQARPSTTETYHSHLRNGGNTFSLMQILGHTHLAMTSRYVALAQADLANQHRQFSPLDKLRTK